MKNIPFQLLTSHKRQTASTSFLVKIVDKDNVAYGFTTLDAALTVNDGFHTVQYLPDQELVPQNIMNSSDMSVDNTELHGWFNELIENRVVAGMFSFGEITIYRVNYLRVWYGLEVVSYGTVGEVQYTSNNEGVRKVEFRDLSQELRQVVNEFFSLTCRAQFGDERCGMPFVWEAATISDINDQFLRFKVAGLVRPDDWFNLGVVRFEDGPNAGKTLEIESWTADGWLTLSFVTPFPVDNGDLVSLRQDCMKTLANCYAYGNVLRMRAEPHTPVEETSLMIPGAYIKSNNSL